jgi:hypothetical protein
MHASARQNSLDVGVRKWTPKIGLWVMPLSADTVLRQQEKFMHSRLVYLTTFATNQITQQQTIGVNCELNGTRNTAQLVAFQWHSKTLLALTTMRVNTAVGTLIG